MNHASSSEFSQPQKSVFFGKGARVRILRGDHAGELGTVTYACQSERGHSVTVRLDAGGEKVTLPACDLRVDAALF